MKSTRIEPMQLTIVIPPSRVELKLVNSHTIGTLTISQTGIRFKSPRAKKGFNKEVSFDALLALMRSGVL